MRGFSWVTISVLDIKQIEEGEEMSKKHTKNMAVVHVVFLILFWNPKYVTPSMHNTCYVWVHGKLWGG